MPEKITFVQLADTQFGMFARFSGIPREEIEELRARSLNVREAPAIVGYEDEKRLFDAAIDAANALNPDFVVVCGDMVNTPADPVEVALVKECAARLSPKIPIYWAPGNHDVGADTVVPTRDSIAAYRRDFGPDYYSFDLRGVRFLVIDSVVFDHPENVPGELDRQMQFVSDALQEARERSMPVIVFTHHPLFLNQADESGDDPDWAPSPPHQDPGYWSINLERRRPLLDMFRRSNVKAVFAGHWHRNHYTADNGMLMITTSSVGYPLGDDPSGYRVVTVGEDASISHEFFPLE